MSKQNKIDFFGIKKSPSFLGGKSNLNFLGNNKKALKSKGKKKNSQKGFIKPRKNNLINLNYKQAKKRFPGLAPWGDADLDGSPNKHDCKPFNASKDAKKKPFAEKLVSQIERKKKPKVDFAKIAKKLAKEEAAKKKARRDAFLRGKDLRPLRKVLTKKTKKGVVVRKFETAGRAVQAAAQLAGVPAAFPRKAKSRKGESVRASAGRPKGSFKFSIPGRGPVPIHVYKKWLAEQKAKAKIEALARLKAIQSGQQAPIDGEQFQEELPQEEFEEAPQQFEAEPRQLQPSPDQIRQQIQQARVLQSQQQIQQQRVAKGDLDFGRGGIQDSSGGNILNAPNVAKGELRNVGEVPSVRLGDRPQTNPQGELFTQVDPITGRTLVRRRISEKFATGEAL